MSFYDYYIYFVNGIIQIQQENFTDAILSLTNYLESEPKDKDALYQRGFCYYKANDYEKACGDWEKIKNNKYYKSNILIRQICGQ